MDLNKTTRIVRALLPTHAPIEEVAIHINETRITLFTKESLTPFLRTRENFELLLFHMIVTLDIEGPLKMPLPLTEWIDVMLSSKIINSRIGEFSVRRSVTRDTPQESVLPPQLWLLVINGILINLEQTETKVMAYDVAQRKFLQTISNLMQGTLGKLPRLVRGNSLRVSPSETELVLFKGKRKLSKFSPPVVDRVTFNHSSGHSQWLHIRFGS